MRTEDIHLVDDDLFNVVAPAPDLEHLMDASFIADHFILDRAALAAPKDRVYRHRRADEDVNAVRVLL